VDWLQNTQKGVKGLVTSKNKRLKKVLKENSGDGGRIMNIVAKRKKAGGALQHPVLTLKKVARLPIKDREEVLKVLRKSKIMNALKHKIRNRRRQRAKVTRSLEDVNHNSFNKSSSHVSVQNDWKNWMSLNGSEDAKLKGMQEIGKIIGVSFPGCRKLNGSVLSRSKNLVLGPILSPVGVGGAKVDGGV